MIERVVADTNVFISALMFGGLPGAFLDLAMQQVFQLVTSAELLTELDEKLRDKFAISDKDAQLIQSRLKKISIVVNSSNIIDAVKDDPDDNRVLEAAIAGKAHAIVSGDRHLLRVGNYSGIPIRTVRQFMDISMRFF